MFIQSLYLRHFRNYEETFLEFSPGCNYLCGENAQGKTNLIEALYLLIFGKSFRTHQLSELIYQGKEAFYLEASFCKHGIEQTLKLSFNGRQHKIFHNQTLYPTWISLLGIVPGVLFAPEDHALVKGAPLARRQFMDVQLIQADLFYVHHLTRFHRAMKQRNHLLRAQRCHTIESWEHEMATSAAYIIQKRKALICELNARCSDYYFSLCGKKESLSLEYKEGSPALDDQEDIRKAYLVQLHSYRAREMKLGHTLVGPHKDDLLFFLDGKDVRLFASEGQARCVVAALKFGEWARLSEEIENRAIMSVDDLGISLDKKRRNALMEQLRLLGQVFISSTEPPQEEGVSEGSKLFCVNNGSVHLLG